MKNFAMTLCLVGSVLALSACAAGQHHSGHSHEAEQNAPYSESRTVGSEKPEVVFQRSQVK